tara:strand:+ start:144 stop:530 length:387 start_codon:yes stop_codon:yes gene_type:complete
MSSKEKLIIEFRDQLIKFLDELIDQFPSESQFIIIRILVKDQILIEDVLGQFIKDILPEKNNIKQRKDTFFTDNKFLKTKNGSLFKTVWECPQLDKEDREIIWKWIDLFVYLGEQYYDQYGFIKGWEN